MLRSRAFAGYLRFPIPHPLDAHVLATITDRRKRDRLSPDDAGILAVFGHRKAVEAVRNSDVATLKEGFIGIAVASELHGDYREVCMGLVVLFHCARLLGVTDQEAIEWVASSGFSHDAVDALRDFSQRSERDRSLAAFYMREDGSGKEFHIR